jgi:hypothetical protein
MGFLMLAALLSAVHRIPQGQFHTCQSLLASAATAAWPATDALLLDLLDPATARELSARPERLWERIEVHSAPRHVLIVEVKNSAQARPEDLRGLRAFARDYPEASRWLLYRGSESLRRDSVLSVSVEEFLRRLRPGSFPE